MKYDFTDLILSNCLRLLRLNHSVPKRVNACCLQLENFKTHKKFNRAIAS